MFHQNKFLDAPENLATSSGVDSDWLRETALYEGRARGAAYAFSLDAAGFVTIQITNGKEIRFELVLLETAVLRSATSSNL